ncbi:DUF5123 domain-containing protein [Chitinophaga sp. Cy-1792]|uniref:DUF5123 domain-containing protein n=1 Tax=Chitinophaga sp. Cy-1792 TaxID=2608339 RepID=UPI00141ED499|nr:DUF5123 domain-containing protein [Chitinophaga sp. Cy-1792]NIG57530.1 DUF5123 domain-containing protein [Chitinophaga sp. Cy-1792]
MSNKIYQYTIGILLCGLLGLVACNRDKDVMNLSRMFMPSGDIKVTSGETSAFITWKAAINTTKATYTVQLSKDSTFGSFEKSFTTDTSGITITDDNLAVRTKYYVRVRTNGADSTKNSYWLRSGAFSITGEQWLLTIGSTDVIDTAAIIKWKGGANMVKLVFSAKGATDIIATIDASDNTANQKVVNTLVPSSTYTVEVYDNNNKSKGILTFTTKNRVPFNNLRIDLTGFTGRPGVLTDTIPTVPAGSTIILKRGESYNVAAELAIGKSLTIIAENSFNTTLPTINFTSNLNFVAGTSIDSIVFKDLYLKGASYGASYLLNADKAATLNKLSFEACKIEIMRGVVRLKSSTVGTTVNNTSFNNCIIDSIADYGVVNGNASAAFLNVSITNSTIYKAQKVVVGGLLSNSVVISDCTFNEAPLGGSKAYLVDYAAANVTNGIKLTNVLMGVGGSSSGNVTVLGYRAGTGTSISASNTYSLGDYVTSSAAIPGVIAYSGLSTAVFTDPAKGNFLIKDAIFAGRSTSGDPRWRK